VVARVKKTRLTLIQRCVRTLKRWSIPYLPANERAASAVSAKRCEPIRVRLRRGRTLTAIVLLVVWPVLAR
jgi:hypothetical protein